MPTLQQIIELLITADTSGAKQAGEALTSLSTSTTATQQSFAGLNPVMTQGAQSILQMGGTATETRQRLADLGLSGQQVSQVMSGQLTPSVQNANEQAKTGSAGFTEFAKGLGSIGPVSIAGGLALAQVGEEVRHLIETVVEEGMQFQESEAQLQAWGNLSSSQAKAVGEAFAAQAGTVTISAGQFVAALASVTPQLELINGGTLTAAQDTQFMAAAWDLGEASGQKLEQTTAALASVQLTYSHTTQQAAQDAGLLLAATELTGVGSDQLAMVIGRLHDRFGPLAPDLQGTVVLLTQFEMAGVTGQRGLMIISSAVDHLLANGKATAAELENLRISLYNADGSAKPLEQTFTAVSTALAGMSDQQRIEAENALFGASGGAALDAVMKNYLTTLPQATAAVQAHSNAEEQATTRAATLSGEIAKLGSAIADLAGKANNLIGSNLASYFEGISQPVAHLQGGLEALTSTWDKLPAPIRDFISGSLAAAAAQEVMTAATGMLTLAAGPFAVAVRLAGDVLNLLPLPQTTLELKTTSGAVDDLTAHLSTGTTAGLLPMSGAVDDLTRHLSDNSVALATDSSSALDAATAWVALNNEVNGAPGEIDKVTLALETALAAEVNFSNGATMVGGAVLVIAEAVAAVGKLALPEIKREDTKAAAEAEAEAKRLVTQATSDNNRATQIDTQSIQANMEGHTALSAALAAEAAAYRAHDVPLEQSTTRTAELQRTQDSLDATATRTAASMVTAALHESDSLQSVVDAQTKAGAAADVTNAKYDALISGSFAKLHEISAQAVSDEQQKGLAAQTSAQTAQAAWAGFDAAYRAALASEAAAIQAGDKVGADYWKNQAAAAKTSADSQKTDLEGFITEAEKDFNQASQDAQTLYRAMAAAGRASVADQRSALADLLSYFQTLGSDIPQSFRAGMAGAESAVQSGYAALRALDQSYASGKSGLTQQEYNDKRDTLNQELSNSKEVYSAESKAAGDEAKAVTDYARAASDNRVQILQIEDAAARASAQNQIALTADSYNQQIRLNDIKMGTMTYAQQAYVKAENDALVKERDQVVALSQQKEHAAEEEAKANVQIAALQADADKQKAIIEEALAQVEIITARAVAAAQIQGASDASKAVVAQANIIGTAIPAGYQAAANAASTSGTNQITVARAVTDAAGQAANVIGTAVPAAYNAADTAAAGSTGDQITYWQGVIDAASAAQTIDLQQIPALQTVAAGWKAQGQAADSALASVKQGGSDAIAILQAEASAATSAASAQGTLSDATITAAMNMHQEASVGSTLVNVLDGIASKAAGANSAVRSLTGTLTGVSSSNLGGWVPPNTQFGNPNAGLTSGASGGSATPSGGGGDFGPAINQAINSGLTTTAEAAAYTAAGWSWTGYSWIKGGNSNQGLWLGQNPTPYLSPNGGLSATPPLPTDVPGFTGGGYAAAPTGIPPVSGGVGVGSFPPITLILDGEDITQHVSVRMETQTRQQLAAAGGA